MIAASTSSVHNAIHLYRNGDYAIVAVEIDGRWIEVIREFIDSNFSHIVEPEGIARAAAKQRAKESNQ